MVVYVVSFFIISTIPVVTPTNATKMQSVSHIARTWRKALHKLIEELYSSYECCLAVIKIFRYLILAYHYCKSLSEKPLINTLASFN